MILETFISWLPTDLAPGHLQRTWLYWLCFALLVLELGYMLPRTLRYLRALKATPEAAGPWGESKRPSPLVLVSMRAQMVISSLIVIGLGFASAVTFYIALLSTRPPLSRFLSNIPKASSSTEKGRVIGALIGALLQVLLLIVLISTLDPTSTFPLHWENHLID